MTAAARQRGSRVERTQPAAAPALLEMYQAMVLEVPVGQPIAIIGEAGEDVGQLALYDPGSP